MVFPPSAGRLGGGRVGKPWISSVHSLVSRGVPAGGVGERMVCPAWRFGGGGDPLRRWRFVERGCRSASFPAFASRWSCGSLASRAGGRGAAAPVVEASEGDGEVNQIEGDDGEARWRFLGAEVRRLPVRHGTPSDPRLKWWSGGGAPAARLLRQRRLRCPAGPSCNFLYLVDWSVRTLV